MSTNTDFLFWHLFLTPSHHHNPTTTATSLPRRRRQNTGGAQKGMETGKGRVYQVRPLYFFIYFYFLLFPSSTLSPPPTMPCPVAEHKKRAICGAFFDFGGYSSSEHEKREHIRVFRVWWVSCPAPVAANPLTCLSCPLPAAKHEEHAAWGMFFVFGTHRTRKTRMCCG